MPFVRHREISSWDRLAAEGIEILTTSDANQLQLPSIHIGFLNMMPDRALRATERQFLRLIAAAQDNYLIYIYPITVDGLNRKDEALAYVEDYYDTFEIAKSIYLDGLVLTGANPGKFKLEDERYWPYFVEVIHWAESNVPSIMCSCLASHAILNVLHGIERTRCIPSKRWGVFSHQICQSLHPLVEGIETEFDAPRSHVFEMTTAQLETCGAQVLASSAEADFHIAVSADGLKWVYLQGHPEYDSFSLLKEYKREIGRYTAGVREDYPEYPKNYLCDAARQILDRYRITLLKDLELGNTPAAFPESDVLPFIENTWSQPGKLMFKNWIDLIAELTLTDLKIHKFAKAT